MPPKASPVVRLHDVVELVRIMIAHFEFMMQIMNIMDERSRRRGRDGGAGDGDGGPGDDGGGGGGGKRRRTSM